MSSLETTELKLKTTPTGGVDAPHSPYYRRLLSAGYKGYLQGTIGGASLYGTIGLVIGGLVATPLIVTGALGVGAAASLALAVGAAGIFKGASTFGSIGSTAAINAESADLSEQRRYLLDRYYDLPEGPEGDREAAAIKQELMREREGRETPPPLFHWQTALIGAALGAALAFGFMYFSGAVVTGALIHATAESVLHVTLTSAVSNGLAAMSTVALTAITTLGGALVGSSIGIDRYYVRKWFDHTEGVVHGSSHQETALIARSEQVARLKAAAKEDERTKAHLSRNGADAATSEPVSNPTASLHTMPATAERSPEVAPIASLNTAAEQKPSTKIMASQATLHSRMADIQRAMEIPAI